MLAAARGAPERRTGGPGADGRGRSGIARRAGVGPELRPIGVLFWWQLQVGVVAIVHRAGLPEALTGAAHPAVDRPAREPARPQRPEVRLSVRYDCCGL